MCDHETLAELEDRAEYLQERMNDINGELYPYSQVCVSEFGESVWERVAELEYLLSEVEQEFNSIGVQIADCRDALSLSYDDYCPF